MKVTEQTSISPAKTEDEEASKWGAQMSVGSTVPTTNSTVPTTNIAN
jgi:hypothetical protein